MGIRPDVISGDVMSSNKKGGERTQHKSFVQIRGSSFCLLQDEFRRWALRVHSWKFQQRDARGIDRCKNRRLTNWFCILSLFLSLFLPFYIINSCWITTSTSFHYFPADYNFEKTWIATVFLEDWISKGRYSPVGLLSSTWSTAIRASTGLDVPVLFSNLSPRTKSALAQSRLIR